MKTRDVLRLIKEIESKNCYGVNRSLFLLKKELEILDRCAKYGKNIASEVEKQIIIKNKVQIGGGRRMLPDFINIDINEPADIICDVRVGMPLPNNSVSLVFAEHFLEHIDYPISVKKFFTEANRILKSKGKLIVGVPDAGLVLDKYFSDKKFLKKIKKKWYLKRNIYDDIDSDIDVVNLVFRDQDSDDVYSQHYWGYDRHKLKKLFKDAGFKMVRGWKFDPKIANPKREFCSLYLEGRKA